MAKGQVRSNKEARKPKKDKPAKPGTASASAASKAQPQAWKQKPPKS